jgi:hypothetical protein
MGLCAQPCSTDSLTIRHWNLQSNCNLHFFKDRFVGVLLDGNQLHYMDVFFDKIYGDSVVQYKFESNNDTLTIYEFEQKFQEDCTKNDTLLLSAPPYLNENYYLRQYVFIRDADHRYLLISFQVDKENTDIINNRYCRKSDADNTYKNTYTCFLMIYTKIFLFPPHHQWRRVNDPFYALYNIDTKEINYFFIGTNLKQ